MFDVAGEITAAPTGVRQRTWVPTFSTASSPLLAQLTELAQDMGSRRRPRLLPPRARGEGKSVTLLPTPSRGILVEREGELGIVFRCKYPQATSFKRTRALPSSTAPTSSGQTSRWMCERYGIDRFPPGDGQLLPRTTSGRVITSHTQGHGAKRGQRVLSNYQKVQYMGLRNPTLYSMSELLWSINAIRVTVSYDSVKRAGCRQ